MSATDGGDSAVSRVLVIGAEAETRQHVLTGLLQLCGQEAASNASEGVHDLTLKTKYYTADLELHVHTVEANELLTPLAHDADQYEALVWVVDAASDSSFLGTERFVGNSIEELEFDVSLVVGTRAASASLVQLRRLEQWAQDNGFEFVAVEENVEKREAESEDPLNEKRGLARVKEALECNMWASLKTLDKPVHSSNASVMSVARLEKPEEATVGEDAERADEQDTLPASRILVLGADLAEQHDVVKWLTKLSGAHAVDSVGEIVQELKLKTKYYEADVELHLHRVDTNELVTALQHDVDSYEALVWVVDASSDRSFKEVQHFIERSIEELTFEVSLLVATHLDHASSAQVGALENWCQDNTFEFIGVSAAEKSPTASLSTVAADHEKQGMDRVLEALHCNMWRSMKTLLRETESKPILSASAAPPAPAVPTIGLAATEALSAAPPAPVAASDSVSHDMRLQASLTALSGAGLISDDDPEMEAFSGLFSQVQRIRESGAVLSDEERRRQAERVAMQLWNLLGADDDEDAAVESAWS